MNDLEVETNEEPIRDVERIDREDSEDYHVYDPTEIKKNQMENDKKHSEDYHNPEPTQGEQDAQERNGLRFIYQFVSHKTGDRSQPFVGNWDSLHDAILNQEEENQDVEDEDYILVVCMLDSDDGVKIPGTPLMTTKTFCKWMDFQRVEDEIA